MRASKSLLLLAVAVAAMLPARAQYDTPIAQSARSGALGGSVFYIPGEQNINIDYRRGFMLAVLADKSLHLQLSAGPRGTAVVAYSHRGDAVWHEQQALLAYGLQATEWLHVAVAARWLHRGVGDVHYEAHQWLAPSVLLQASWHSTRLTLLAGTRPWDDQSPWRLHLQVAYNALPHLLAVAEVEHEERTRLRMGMEYDLDGRWYIRAGLATRPMLPTFGLGARWRNCSIDLAAQVHSALGITPQTSLSLWF